MNIFIYIGIHHLTLMNIIILCLACGISICSPQINISAILQVEISQQCILEQNALAICFLSSEQGEGELYEIIFTFEDFL